MVKLDHIVINASNIEESTQFYEMVFISIGFNQLAAKVWGNKFTAIELRAAKELHAYHRLGAGVNHIGFGTSSLKELHTIIDDLNNAGMQTPATQLIDGAICLFLPDPDGLRVEISWDPAYA